MTDAPKPVDVLQDMIRSNLQAVRDEFMPVIEKKPEPPFDADKYLKGKGVNRKHRRKIIRGTKKKGAPRRGK